MDIVERLRNTEKHADREHHRLLAKEAANEIERLRDDVGTWRDISTAPKRRLLLVGFFNELGKWRSAHAQYRDDLPQHDDADGDELAPAGWYEGSLEADMLFAIRPTHWRPLPESPGNAETAEKDTKL